MYKNIKVEAENLELIIENSHGDKAIIPANKRDWVKQKLSEGCHSCIDSLVETLPIASQYAQDGSVYPSVRTTKFDDTTENKYQQWRASLPKNLQYEGDYDLRGFYKENPDFNINDSEQHLTDKWKLPNHPTFSDESVYYKGNENYGGKWKSYDYGDVYTPNNPEVKQQKLEWKKGFYSKDKVVVDGKLYDINTPEYKEIYDKGIGYFDKTGTFISSKEDLPEVTVSSKIQPNTVSSYISEFAKQTPKEEYLQNKSREHNKKFYSAPLWAQQVVGGYNEERKKSDRKRDEEDYNKLQSNFITEKLLNRNKQKDNETRVQWLQRFSDKELEVIKNSDYKSKIEPSIWSKFEQGLLSIGNAGSPVTFKNENLTQEEAKKEDNPLNILQPLSIPSKMVQSSYKDGYSFTDALKGKNNNAGIVEDIVTDPLNLVGVGLAGKLSKADKIIDATKAGSKVLNKLDDAVNNINRIKFDDFKNDNEFFRIIVGDEAFDDIVQTQKIRTKQPSSVKNTPPNTINLDRRGSTAFPSFSKGSPSLSYANDNPNHYIIRTADESIKPSTSGRHGKGTTMFPTDKSGKHLTELDASKVQVYKHVGNGEYELVNTAKPIISSVDDVVKNLPKLEQVPLDFKIEDVLKNISSTERKNMEIIKKGNAYFKELDNPESLKRLKEFGDEYNIDLLDAYKKAEKRWDYGTNIGKHERFQVKKTDEDWYGLSTAKWDYEDELKLFQLKQTFGENSKQVKDFYKTISQEKSINYIADVVPLDRYEKTIWHELSHDINKSIIDQSPKLQKDIKNIFIEKGTADINKVKKGREYVAEYFYTKKDKILKDLDNPENLQKIGEKEFDYVTRPTETWAFLSTNLRQDLKNTGIIKKYNELLTPEKLEQAIKNGNTVFSRFEPYIKDKEAFIKLFNKMTLSIAPAVLYFKSQNQQNKSEQ